MEHLELLSLLDYKNGGLYWRVPRQKTKVGQRFGGINLLNKGYRSGVVHYKRYYEHRLIWFYHHGKWPKGDLDHINGNKADNRIENLREATRTQNNFNKDNFKGTSQYKGVYYRKDTNKWAAQYWYEGKRYGLGCYLTEIDAAKAYDDAVTNLEKDYVRKNIND